MEVVGIIGDDHRYRFITLDDVEHETQIFISRGVIESLVRVSEQLHFLSLFLRKFMSEIISVKN